MENVIDGFQGVQPSRAGLRTRGNNPEKIFVWFLYSIATQNAVHELIASGLIRKIIRIAESPVVSQIYRIIISEGETKESMFLQASQVILVHSKV